MENIKWENTAIKSSHHDINNNIFKDKIKGTTCFICPKCHKIIYIYADCKIKLHSTLGELDFVSIKMNLICPHCDNEFSVFLSDGIDINIVDTIKTLNKYGYPTIFSCEGDCGSDPYILFSTSNKADMKYRTREAADLIRAEIDSCGKPLPWPWYIDEGDFTNDKYPSVCIRAHIIGGQDVRIEALKAINKWAHTLLHTKEIWKYDIEHNHPNKKKK